LAGSPGTCGVLDGSFSEALFDSPIALYAATNGIYVADWGEHTIRLMRSAPEAAPKDAPELQVALIQGKLLLSWPARDSSYRLEANNELDGTGTWAAVPNPVVVTDNVCVVVIDLPQAAAFYRLSPAAAQE
jgi:hypothetical protein